MDKLHQNQKILEANQKRLENKVDQMLYLIKELPKKLCSNTTASEINHVISEDVEKMFPIKMESSIDEIELRLAENLQFKQQG